MGLPALSPFRPGYNQLPMYLAGRDEVLNVFMDSIRMTRYRTPASMVLIGARGMGKTVLLHYLASLAEKEEGFAWIHTEAVQGKSILEDITVELEPSRMVNTSLQARIPGLSATIDIPGMKRSLIEIMTDFLDKKKKKNSGLILTIDEAQEASGEDIRILASLHQEFTAHNFPLIMLLAGLPSLRNKGALPTYMERGEWFDIGLLSTYDSRLALQKPIEQSGKSIDDSALETLITASGKYPYAIQLFGDKTWNVAENSLKISQAHVAKGLETAQRTIESGLYAKRWHEATWTEKKYLYMAATLSSHDQLITNSAVAEKLGKTAKALSVIRARLLQQGTLIAEGTNLKFPVPGMANYILKQDI